MSREQSRQDKTQLKEEVEELRGLLDARDGEIKVIVLLSIVMTLFVLIFLVMTMFVTTDLRDCSPKSFLLVKSHILDSNEVWYS